MALGGLGLRENNIQRMQGDIQVYIGSLNELDI